ncbi:hypothetical protein [Pandoraea sp. NPDC090278]|uniref:hypothetical protein n=1 Tax=Pandoraea sp. NPDC090278 TaxID=3364391 RepID=UPI00383A607A
MPTKTHAKTDRTRMGDQRRARLAAGWNELRLWAASDADANTLKAYAEELKMKSIENKMRAHAAERGLPHDVLEGTLAAVRTQDSDKFTSPSGATLELMNVLLRGGAVKETNIVYELAAIAHPGNARVIAGKLPTKVREQYLMNRLDYRGGQRAINWEAAHPTWADDAIVALQDGKLDVWADQALEDIRATDA